MKPSNEQILRDAVSEIVERFGPCESDYIFSKRAALQKCRAALAATAPESAPADAQSTAERTQQHNQLLLLRYSNWTEFKEMATLNRVQGTADEFLHLGFRAGYACTRPAPSQSADQVRDDDVAEGLEILDSLIENIEQQGNYSKDATLFFLGQIRQCLATSSAAKGEAA